MNHDMCETSTTAGRINTAIDENLERASLAMLDALVAIHKAKGPEMTTADLEEAAQTLAEVQQSVAAVIALSKVL